MRAITRGLAAWALLLQRRSGAAMEVVPRARNATRTAPRSRLVRGERVTSNWLPVPAVASAHFVPSGGFVQREGAGGPHHTTVVESWVVLSLIYGGSLDQKAFKTMAEALRNSIADTLELCRPAVHVKDMRAVNVDVEYQPLALLEKLRRSPVSFTQRFRQIMRHYRAHRLSELELVNLTQVKATYEVRVFDEMRCDVDEVARKVDSLSTFGRFSEFGRATDFSLYELNESLADRTMLDDIGYASTLRVARPPIDRRQRQDCREEMLLEDARVVHEYTVMVAFGLVMLITCAGSAVFTLKQPSLVPSRLNPLIRQPYI